MSTGAESTTSIKKEPLPHPTKVTSPPPTGSIQPIQSDAFDAKPKNVQIVHSILQGKMNLLQINHLLLFQKFQMLTPKIMVFLMKKIGLKKERKTKKSICIKTT